MGIYIFNWKLLREKLVADDKNPDSHHDFGKDIIPGLLAEHKRLFAWRFEGYWKDVGTIDSLWEANMDLIYRNDELDLDDPSWKIYTEDSTSLPQYVGAEGKVINSYVNQGCVIEGTVEKSVLFADVTVAKGATVVDSVILPGAEIGEGAVINRCIIAENVKVDAGCTVGCADSKEIELVSEDVKGDN
jgi:glucose-1-phosphate adenylyltransferase